MSDGLEELRTRRELGARMGGSDSIAFHHGRGKLTVRERLALLVDDGSLREFGYLTGRASYDADPTWSTSRLRRRSTPWPRSMVGRWS